jgi:23S rRNA pseudouridine1911/1915/1917 synthase
MEPESDPDQGGEADILLERQVGTERAGQRLDQAAAELFPDYSRARLQRWIRESALTVNGHRGRPSQRLAGGEWLRLEAELRDESEVVPQDLPLQVIHADRHLLVIDKPPGLVVHPAAGHPDGTLQNALLHHFPELASLPRSGIVHRLDRDTSGVMVVARSLKAHASLVDQLQERRMGRIYRAVAHGLAPERGTVDAPIGRHPRDRKRMAVVEGGKPAVTHFRRLAGRAGFCHLELSLESGRTHQIRVHLQQLGFPLVGDPVYGRRHPRKADSAGLSEQALAAVRDFPRQALHALRLKLEDPASGRERRFEAPLPRDFTALLEALGLAIDRDVGGTVEGAVDEDAAP